MRLEVKLFLVAFSTMVITTAANAQCIRGVKGQTDDSARHHEAVGLALMQEGMTASTVRRPFIIMRVKKELELAVCLDSTLVDARRGLVTFYSMAPGAMGGSMSKAREHASAIMKLNQMRGHIASGVIAERTKDTIAAEREFRAAITLHPDSIAPYNALGGFYRRQKRVDDAIAMYRKVIALDPENDNAKKALESLIGERK